MSEAVDLPEGVTIRAERPGDVDAIAAVVSAAFRSEGEARLVAEIRSSPGFIPELSLVAEVDGKVVGHVMISEAALRDGDVERRVVSLSPLAVDPGFERRGIGSALVRTAARRADEQGEALVVLEGSPLFYGRLGFEHAALAGIEIDLPDWAPPEAAQVLRLGAYDPSLRGRLVYPPAFDAVAEH